MKMRLKPQYKKDSAGNILPDWVDLKGKPHYVKRKWYASFKYKGKFYGNSLDADKENELEAYKNLVVLSEQVKLGKFSSGMKKKIKLLSPVDLKRYKPKEFDIECKGIQKTGSTRFLENIPQLS